MGRAVGEERGLHFLFQDWDFPAAWCFSGKKKKLKISNHGKKIKIDLQWNNIIFIVTATVVPWESRTLENFNFYKVKEFTSLNKIQGITQDNHSAAGGIFHSPPESGSFLIIFSVGTLQNPKQDSKSAATRNPNSLISCLMLPSRGWLQNGEFCDKKNKTPKNKKDAKLVSPKRRWATDRSTEGLRKKIKIKMAGPVFNVSTNKSGRKLSEGVKTEVCGVSWSSENKNREGKDMAARIKPH